MRGEAHLLSEWPEAGAWTDDSDEGLYGSMRYEEERRNEASGTTSDVRSPSTDVRSPTSTSSDVRSPTSTETRAYTAHNFTATVTGGSGGGTTNVSIYPSAGKGEAHLLGDEASGPANYGEAGHHQARGPANYGEAGAGVVTPGDVLSYRDMWNDYVMGTARAAATCAQAWRDLAAKKAPSTPPNITHFAVPPDAATIALWADSEQSISDSIVSSWNMHAGKKDWEIVALASDILRDFQNTVRNVGERQLEIARDCSALALPKPPSLDVQKQVVSRIEGLGILAHGILQLLGIGIGGALDAYVAVGQRGYALASKSLDVVPWIMGGAVLLGALYLLAQEQRYRRSAA